MKFFQFIKKYGLLSLGTLMLGFLLFVAFFGRYFPIVDTELRESTFVWQGDIPIIPPYAPSDQFPFGTDTLGRDLLSIIVMGAKETILIVVGITIIRYLIALPIGFLAHKKLFGFQHLLNALNQFLSYIPSIIVVIMFVTLPPILFTDMRPFYFIIIIAMAEVGRVADFLKAEFDQLSSKEFIEGGIAVGISPWRLVYKYYFPFIYNKTIINIVTDMGKVMFLLGQLGFIGIFVAQKLVQTDIGVFDIVNSSISWPMLLANANRDLHSAVWIPFFSSLAMTYCIFTFNILAQGLQNVLQRKNHYI